MHTSSSSSSSEKITLSVLEAQHLILEAMHPLCLSEQVALENALDRISTNNIPAPINVPAFDNSAMDGYAFCAQDLNDRATLSLVGSAFAGHPFQAMLQPEQAIRITTGAPMPKRADTVLPYELAILADANTLDMRNVTVKAGQHRRCCGEDLKIGSTAISKGQRLRPAELGLLASLGLSEITVQRRVRVALFSTGDELRSTGQSVGSHSGGIYDSNRITLRAMLMRFGAEVIDLGVLPDDPVKLENALTEIASKVDVIITSGGLSGGIADYTGKIMQKIGNIQFLSINMRPGRQFAFGKVTTSPAGNDSPAPTYLFGLPGNPVAVMVSFYFLVRPALQRLNGAQTSPPLQINAIAMHDIPKKIGRTEFQRGICEADREPPQLRVRITGKQGSGILSSMSEANCMVVLENDQADIKAGDNIKIILFEGML